ncbi:adhesion and aggregation factor [Sugiyamaella lignohabitans]|uniref:Adhesion and aggregation factor n=1 Tax=Sugiyamaella lignohabitans TaxID=796027 RepID=A0A167C8C4_9ASCO|nr:adhesion and aggregation factor [Sugiyamaella lignohabitans]ANB11349.1 adhesion and aggregation factor [Sugiyamaella lignohabitans]
MYSSSYSSLYQHTAAATNPYPTNHDSNSPLASFNGLPGHSIDQSSASSSSASSTHPGMTSPLGNFPSTGTRNPVLGGSSGVGNYLAGPVGSASYPGNEDLIPSSAGSSAYQLVSGGNNGHGSGDVGAVAGVDTDASDTNNSATNANATGHSHSMGVSSNSSNPSLLVSSTAAPYGFTFPPLPPNEGVNSGFDPTSPYNLYQPTTQSSANPGPSGSSSRRGHKSSSSLASILIKPDLSVDSSNRQVNTGSSNRNPSPHRPSASITTATAELSLGDSSARDQSSSYGQTHHHRRRSSTTSLSPMKANTSSSTAASTPGGSSSSLAASSAAAAYRSHRRRRSAKSHSIDRDSVILSLYKQGKPLSEIARVAGLETEEEVRMHYELVINRRVDWNAEDIDCLKDLLEAGERAKWKYISDEVSRERNKRIPATACQKKFKEMFGVAEASSILGSSLCYVVFPDGWASLDTKPIDTSSSTSRQLQSVYENETLAQ